MEKRDYQECVVIGMAMIDLPDEGSVELVQNTTLGWQVSGGARAHAGLEWVPPGSRESEIQRGENPPRPQGSSLLLRVEPWYRRFRVRCGHLL